MSDVETESLTLQRELLSHHRGKSIGDLSELDLAEFRIMQHLDMQDAAFGLVVQRWAAEVRIRYELDAVRKILVRPETNEAPRGVGRAWRWIADLFHRSGAGTLR